MIYNNVTTFHSTILMMMWKTRKQIHFQYKYQLEETSDSAKVKEPYSSQVPLLN